MVMGITSQLGAFAAGLTYGGIPPDVRERCRMSVLDGIGIMLGAADFAACDGDRRLKTYLEAMAPPGNVNALGYGIRTTSLMAAFANGTLMEALDCQDTNLGIFAHSGTAVIPTALALAEANQVTWSDLVAAIVAGYEIHARLLWAVQPSHNNKGFLATGTFGTCAAAVTAGRALGLNAEQMTNALGIAGFVMPISNQDNQFKGHNAKPVHGGHAAMSGLSAAHLAQVGYEAAPLEGEAPRYQAALTMLGDGHPNLERAIAGLNETWHTRDTAYKPYPIGHLIVGVIELILDILAQRRIKPDEVAAVDVVTYKEALILTGKKYTTTESNYVDAHLSIAYCVAATLTDGEMTVRQLRKERLRDPKLHELASRVTVSEDPVMNKAFPSDWPAKVVLRLRGGESIERQIDKVKWSPQRTPTWAELAEKFHLMTDPIIGPERAAQAIEIVAGLKEASTLASLMATLQQKSGC